jgi:hypothetical protein
MGVTVTLAEIVMNQTLYFWLRQCLSEPIFFFLFLFTLRLRAYILAN